MEVNFEECRRLLGDQAGANTVLTQALVVALFSQQTGSFDTQRYTTMSRVAMTDASKSVIEAGYQVRQVYATEATRLKQTLGPDHSRTQSIGRQVQRSGAALQQLEVASELSTIRETTPPAGGSAVDGRVMGADYRGKEDLRVELVRADDSPTGVAGRTDRSGYFALAIDERRAQALAEEGPLFVRVTDAQGNVIQRSAQPVAVAPDAPARTTVVVAAQDVPGDVFRRGGTVVYNQPLRRDQPNRSTPLETVRGIGPVTAARLRQAGIPDVETLLRTPGERLVQVAGFDADAVRKEALNVVRAEPSVETGREPRGTDAPQRAARPEPPAAPTAEPTDQEPTPGGSKPRTEPPPDRRRKEPRKPRRKKP
jgi:hypothetical protein